MLVRISPRIRSILWIFAVALVMFLYVSREGDADLLLVSRIAFAFELLCWAGSMALLIHLGPFPNLRISDPGFLLFLWSTVYLVVPSIFWLLGAAIPWSEHITPDLGAELLWMHGVFMFSLTGGYLLARPPKGRHFSIDVRHLPSGWVLFLLPAVPLGIEILSRIAGGGSLLPERTYGETWFALQEGIQASREAGGFGYLRTQIFSKVEHYPALIQGIGLGLILAGVFDRKRRRMHALLVIGAVLLAMLTLGSGVRSGLMIVLLIGLVLADLLIGPLPLRYIGVLVVAGLFVFEFLGVFRAYRDLPVPMAFSDSVEAYLSSDYPLLGEFTSMLSKEALVVQYVRDSGEVEGVSHLVRQALSVVPSQIVPGKLSMESTGDLASRELLGESYYAGAGVAGTMIGDCYRYAGVAGIPLMAALIGAIVGWVQRWLMVRSVPTERTNLLKIGLLAGFMGWTFMVIRNDLGSILVLLLYDCALPLLVVSALLSRFKGSVWISSLSRLA